MATVVFGTYMVRYPLGGVLSSALQWVLGLRALGHDVYVVEKSGWAQSCFDPTRGVMSDDHTYGFKTVSRLLERFGLAGRLCYVDANGCYHGLSQRRVQEAIRAADVFIDRGAHGSWNDEAAAARRYALIDGEPGWRQIKLARELESNNGIGSYDAHFTVGLNIGTPQCTAPTAGVGWKHVMPPVAADWIVPAADSRGAVTTVMNWKAHEEVIYRGQSFGQKDVEFEAFFDLPRLVDLPLELAIAGHAPHSRLLTSGWRLRDAHEVSMSFDSYWDYIRGSRAEFSVAKNVFVRLNTGWFSDRSANYLASGRPVVLQDTGFSQHLPCGEGLFAVRDVDEAAAAIEEIESDYPRHSRAAREIAVEFLDARRVLVGLLSELGVG